MIKFWRCSTVIRSVFVAVGLSGLAHVAFATPASITVKSVAVISDASLDAPARFGVNKLIDALRIKGLTVVDSNDLNGSDFVILVGLANGNGAAAQALIEQKIPRPTGEEALVSRKQAMYRGKPAIILAGSDGTGVMYSALDLAERIGWAKNKNKPFEFARDIDEKPFLTERGVVMFTMNQSYFESRLFDEQFWIRYLDMLAANRFNHLVLTFGYEDGGYMAPLYPYFFDVEGFPKVHVVGLSHEQQTRYFNALKTVFRLAAERGIHVKPGIWEHIYRGKPRGQDGGIDWAADPSKPTSGLVWGLDSKNFVAYTVAALKKFYELFPEIDETQFRMHNESGLNDDEIEAFWHEVFAFYSANKRNVKLELRAKGLPKSVIKDAQAQGLNIQVDTKIWMEQMGLPYHPTHINLPNQMDARHSYADLLEYPQTYRMHWTLWNGGTSRILLWGDPEYAQRMAESARLYDGEGLAVTEMQATKMLGDPHDTKPRDFLNARYRNFDYEFERYWAFYRSMGRFSYNPQTPMEVWQQEFVRRFGTQAAPHIMKALELSSRVLPRIVAASYPYRMFPTTMGWAEAMHMGSLPQFASEEEGTDIQQFMNLRDAATSILAGTDTAMRRPEEISRWFARTSDAILAEVAAAEKVFAHQHTDEFNNRFNREFKATIIDAKMLAALARYHSWRQLGGLNYNLYKQSGDLEAFDTAIADERQAVHAWTDLADSASDLYIDDMTFGAQARVFPRHWKDELKPLHEEFDQLLAERQSATARPRAKSVRVLPLTHDPAPPVVKFISGESVATPDHDFVVKTKVANPARVKWIRLRYRHVNQKEDYQSVDMSLDEQSHVYSASIPGAFVDPHWDLMYFVEVVDRNGNGRIYPDLEVETPYKIVTVKR